MDGGQGPQVEVLLPGQQTTGHEVLLVKQTVTFDLVENL